jgi:GLPGLI family protein
MKNYHFLKILILFIFFFQNIQSQENKCIYAKYSFRNKNNNTLNDVSLYINKQEAYSVFLDYEIKKDSMFEDDFGNIKINLKNNDSIGKQYYLTNKNITFRDHIYTEGNLIPVIVNESMPSFNWKLETDTLTINNYLCNKANLDFRGRNYTFWYTIEIPTQFGPWKFFGLPGLIVKIESEDKSISFQLNKLELTDNNNIEKPKLGKQISFKEYVIFQEKITDDFIEKLKTKLPRGSSMKVNKTERTSIEKNYD